jgi:HSP20 family protein
MRNFIPSIWGSEPRDIFGSFRREMDDIMRDFGRRLPTLWENGFPGIALPSIDVSETRDAVEITAELPGVDEKDVRISIEGNRLVLEGEKKAESVREEKDRTVTERSYGSFRRSVPLSFEPGEADISARFEKGVLTIGIPKPASMKPFRREIPISAQGTKSPGLGRHSEADAEIGRKRAG